MKKIFSYIVIIMLSVSAMAQGTTVRTTTTKKTTVKKSSTKPKSSTSKSTRRPAGVLQWTVDAQRAKCEGAVTMQCLLVKHEGQKAFELFYDNISGFDY